MAVSDPTKVLIIGAGATGLALAQGLKKAGIPFAIYERNDSAHSRRNWDFGVHWGIDALKELVPEELFASLESAQVDPHHPGEASWYQVPLVNAGTGELIKNLEAEKFYRLQRAKLRRWLLTGIEDSVHWGQALANVTYSADGGSVTASFADGSTTIGSLLIGCEGAHSITRTLLVGSEKGKVTPVGNHATLMCYTQHTPEHARFLRSPPHHPLYQTGLHPDGFASFMSVHEAEDKDHPENWTFFHYISYHPPEGHDSWPKEELIKYQKSLAKRFCDPWKSVYDWMDDREANVWNTRVMEWDPSLPEHAWDNHDGRVTLAGDAAHPMSFQRGQGLNNSLQDARFLCRAVKTFWSAQGADPTKRASAIDAYEQEMKERGGREVQLSSATTISLHEPGKAMESGLVKQGVQPSKKE